MGRKCALWPARTNSRGRSCPPRPAGALGRDGPGHTAVLELEKEEGALRRGSLSLETLAPSLALGLTADSADVVPGLNLRASAVSRVVDCALFLSPCPRACSPPPPPPLSFCEDINEGQLAFRRHHSVPQGRDERAAWPGLKRLSTTCPGLGPAPPRVQAEGSRQKAAARSRQPVFLLSAS